MQILGVGRSARNNIRAHRAPRWSADVPPPDHGESRYLFAPKETFLLPFFWPLRFSAPRADGDLGRYMQRLTVTHVRRWHEHRHSVGFGHLYQGAYKSFPVQRDEHFLAVCRYVERHALRSALVERAEAWRCCSMWRRDHRAVVEDVPALCAWPVQRPNSWRRLLNRPQRAHEVDAIRLSSKRGRPYGSERHETHLGLRLSSAQDRRRGHDAGNLHRRRRLC